jgi:hypothetical protein
MIPNGMLLDISVSPRFEKTMQQTYNQNDQKQSKKRLSNLLKDVNIILSDSD